MSNDNLLTVSVSPHIRANISIPRIMWTVVIALMPAFLGSLWFFGIRALVITLLSVIAAIATEAIIQKFIGRKVTILDGSAVITGILLAFNLPPDVPLWMPVIGSVFGIIIGKHVFGGLGYNPLNPALVGRAFLLASWPIYMTASAWLSPAQAPLRPYEKDHKGEWVQYDDMTNGSIMMCGNAILDPTSKEYIEGYTGATPLNILKAANKNIKKANKDLENPEADEKIKQSAKVKITEAKKALRFLHSTKVLWNLAVGKVGGCIGETSAILLLIGGIALIILGYADYRIVISYFATVFILALIFSGYGFKGAMFHILSGGMFLGALFMATDMVTSPNTPKGRWIFGIGCGLLTIIIRMVGGYPEGVSYSILLMNVATPLIDRYTKPKVFGVKKEKVKEKPVEAKS